MSDIKGLFTSIDVSATGMHAQRAKMNATADNIANAETTRTEEGGPYKRKQVLLKPGTKSEFVELLGKEILRLRRTKDGHLDNEATVQKRQNPFQGVIIEGIHEDGSPPRLVYDPSHPDADENGFVAMPNINIVTEMVSMITATRAYEANVTVMNASKNMMMSALDI
ncbi:MAG: flagellar basal body rod protein FlgC [bacterium]|nr:flagellar basal body rod protein FlgC [bacterium]